MTDEVYTFLSLCKSHLFDSILAERRPHMLCLCIRTVCLWSRNPEKIDGIAVTTRAQVLSLSLGQKYGNTRGVPQRTNNSKEGKAVGFGIGSKKIGFGQDLCRKRQ